MKEPVVQTGAPGLKAVATPVTKKELASPAFKKLLNRMSTILKRETYGVAIAAPQVGSSLRVFVVAGKVFMQADAEEGAPPPADKAFINPELIRLSKTKKEMSEGCLSVRGKYGLVVRHEKASVRAWDITGKEFVYHGTGLLAQIFQHEVDHLNGILYTNRASEVVSEQEWEELQKTRAKAGK